MKPFTQSTTLVHHLSFIYGHRVSFLCGILLSLILFTQGCGMIMDDPHPYPDMGDMDSSDESEIQSNVTIMDPNPMNTSVEQE